MRSARWIVPATAATAIVAGAAITQSADASPALAPRTAAQLLVDLQTAPATPVSGTVRDTIDLGLPDLGSSGRASTDPMSLLTGEHTWRVWSDGATKSRVALTGRAAETNIVRNGDQVWAWSSESRTATRSTIPAHDKDAYQSTHAPTGADVPRTPQEAADWALRQLDPTTEVSTAGTGTVAGRDVYTLVLTPRDRASRVASVRLAVDAEKKVPLQVQVYSAKTKQPAIDLGFTDVSFTKPADNVFTFTPPAGAKVVDAQADATTPTDTAEAPAQGNDKARSEHPRPTTVGTGWTTVTVGTIADSSQSAPTVAPADEAAEPARGEDVQALVSALPTSSGAWGSGHVLDGTLFSAVVTDDGRYAVGAVAPSALYAALPAK